MQPTIQHGLIVENTQIASDVFDMQIACPDAALPSMQSVAGQFLQLYLNRGEHILPRPISICEQRDDGVIRILYRVVGDGTKIISRMKKGEKIRILSPLGNGFPVLPRHKNVALVGGGIGVPPLLFLAKQLNSAPQASRVVAYLGFRSEPILLEGFSPYCDEVQVATEDASMGYAGNVVSLFKQTMLTALVDVVYACGPKIMLEQIALSCADLGIACYLSMEQRMACGIGACVGCVVPIKENGAVVYKKVCVDGPVFAGEKVVF